MNMRECWDHYFLRMAEAVKSRATCKRLRVGCVLVSHDRRVLATGYNGSITGLPHCIDSECVVEDGHCINTIHAEMNAIVQAAKKGVPVERCTAYVTHFPCWPCFKVLANVGVREIVYAHSYKPNDLVRKAASACMMALIEMSEDCKGELGCEEDR